MTTREFSTVSVDASPTWSASTTPLPMLDEGSGPGRVLAKGGAVFAVKQRLGLPVKFIGAGGSRSDPRMDRPAP